MGSTQKALMNVMRNEMTGKVKGKDTPNELLFSHRVALKLEIC